MNNAKHTPGPWVAALGERLNTDVYHIDKQGNRVFVAEFATQTDAVLSAAAPAMYAELVNGLGLLEASYHDMCDKYGNDSLQAQTVWEQVERTRNVIAQAEGRHHE